MQVKKCKKPPNLEHLRWQREKLKKSRVCGKKGADLSLNGIFFSKCRESGLECAVCDLKVPPCEFSEVHEAGNYSSCLSYLALAHCSSSSKETRWKKKKISPVYDNDDDEWVCTLAQSLRTSPKLLLLMINYVKWTQISMNPETFNSNTLYGRWDDWLLQQQNTFNYS